MSFSHLLACPGCARHVRAHESSCPFCGAALSDELRAIVPARRPSGRLPRAALYAFGATALTAAAACSSSSTPGEPDASNDGMTMGEVVAHYGCPPATCGSEGGSDGDVPEVTAAYGAPGDAGVDVGGDAAGDVGVTDGQSMDADSGLIAAYGGPPADH